MNTLNRLCVYCGSSPGARPEYVAAARALGRALAGRGIGVVYGGSTLGLMGALAQAAIDAGGEAVGVIPESLHGKVQHPTLTEIHVVDSMHERKALMFELSDGFVALPGGLGTAEELLEVLTWAQLGLHGRPCGVLNTRGYYDPLLRFLDHAVEERFVKRVHRGMVLVADEPEALLDAMETYRAPVVEKWLDRL
jgi:uncharacterized protein (TIGR00730 family)